MSERALKALLGTVAGLGLLWLLITFFPRGDGGAGEPSSALSGFFDGVTAEAVSALRFRSPEDGAEVVLRREGGEWKVNGFRADSANLARFWEALGNAVVGDLVATNPANHPRMGLRADSAWTMEVEAPSGSRSLLVGDPGARYGTAFIRLPGEDEVHLLTGNLRSVITRPLDAWRNKRVATVDTAAIWRIEVDREDEGFAIERSDSLWVMEEGGGSDAATVRGILGEMARLDAAGFYESGDSLSARAGAVRAIDQGGAVRLALEIGSGEGDRWVRAEGDSIIYRIASWRANRIFPDRETVAGGG